MAIWRVYGIHLAMLVGCIFYTK